jgi:hypothetical protein
VAQQIVEFSQQLLGGYVKQFDGALQTFATNHQVDGRVVAAVKGLSLDAVGTKRFHLVLHQTDEWGDDDGCARHGEGGNLITDALSATRGHEHQSIVALEDMSYDFFLVFTERIIAKMSS